MCLNNQNPSETLPLLEEHVETGQIRLLRNSKYRYYILAVVLVALSCLGAGLIIYYAEGKLDNNNMMHLIKRKRHLK